MNAKQCELELAAVIWELDHTRKMLEAWVGRPGVIFDQRLSDCVLRLNWIHTQLRDVDLLVEAPDVEGQ